MQIVECPRDAMQGLAHFISTSDKVAYLQALLGVGFHTLDCGSFVSPKAIPQMRDTAEVLAQLDPGSTRLLTIVANERGAVAAARFPQIHAVGFPLSLSETFQQRNTNRSVAQARQTLAAIGDIALAAGQTLVVYLSMGFGNPYGDPYEVGLVEDLAAQLAEAGVSVIALSDTVGVATPGDIEPLFARLIPRFPHVTFGAHLHTRPETAAAKIAAAYAGGCRRFDVALGGYGGCPMADDDLTGNTPTEVLVQWLQGRGLSVPLDLAQLEMCRAVAVRLMTAAA